MIMLGDKKKALTAILGPRHEEVEKKEGGASDSSAELHAIAHDLVESVHARNVPDVVEALKAFFYACDAMPHVEGEHEE